MMEDSVSLTIDWIPPSVNHYKKPVTLKNGRLSFVRTAEANVFRDAVALKTRGRTITPERHPDREDVRYAVYVTVYLGVGQRGDADNFLKVILDSLQAAGVIHSDARVRRCCVNVEDCDRGNPRTEIRVERIERRTK